MGRRSTKRSRQFARRFRLVSRLKAGKRIAERRLCGVTFGWNIHNVMLISPDAYRRPEVKEFTKFFAPRYAAIFR